VLTENVHGLGAGEGQMGITQGKDTHELPLETPYGRTALKETDFFASSGIKNGVHPMRKQAF